MISKWVLKAIVQKAISFLPYPEKVNYWFQKNVTKGVDLNDEHLGYKVRHARDHLTYFKQYGNTSDETEVLELGTGWYPIVPLLFFLTGSGRVTSIDIQNWLTKEGMRTAILRLLKWYESGLLLERFGPTSEERWEDLKRIMSNYNDYSLSQIKDAIGLQTQIVDARKTRFDSNKFDFICSNNTFEHIYPKVLIDILAEFKRLLRGGGVMSHFIDMSDHFAHFDQTINEYNFLKYSKAQWRVIDNSIQPQNRMRFCEFENLYGKLSIPITEIEIWPYNIENLRAIDIHNDFDHFSEQELAITHGYIISQME